MRAAVALLAIAHLAPVLAADLVLRNKETGAVLRLMEAPCTDEQQGHASVIFADGSTITIPLSAFQDPSV